jgi:hypothetical protein
MMVFEKSNVVVQPNSFNDNQLRHEAVDQFHNLSSSGFRIVKIGRMSRRIQKPGACLQFFRRERIRERGIGRRSPESEAHWRAFRDARVV